MFLGLRLSFFFTRADRTPRDQLISSLDNEPRIVLDDFSIFRYNGHKVESTFSGKLGHFIEPNIVEVYAAVRGVRYRPKNKVETLRCESASALLDADTFSGLMKAKEVELLRAEVEDQVRIGFDDNILSTEFAEYDAKRERVSSYEPVKVDWAKPNYKRGKGI